MVLFFAVPGSTVSTCSATAPGALAVLLLFSTRRGTRILRSSLSCSLVYASASYAEWRSVHSRYFSCLPRRLSHVQIGHYVHEPFVPCSSLFAVQVLPEEFGRFFWSPR